MRWRRPLCHQKYLVRNNASIYLFVIIVIICAPFRMFEKSEEPKLSEENETDSKVSALHEFRIETWKIPITSSQKAIFILVPL